MPHVNCGSLTVSQPIIEAHDFMTANNLALRLNMIGASQVVGISALLRKAVESLAAVQHDLDSCGNTLQQHTAHREYSLRAIMAEHLGPLHDIMGELQAAIQTM